MPDCVRVDCSQEDLQQKRGSRLGAGTKVSSSPPPHPPSSDPADPSRNFFCWEALSREHGWIYDYVMRILDGHWRHVSLTFSWRCLTGKIRCDRSVLVEWGRSIGGQLTKKTKVSRCVLFWNGKLDQTLLSMCFVHPIDIAYQNTKSWQFQYGADLMSL